jgi:hypothetical protein
MTGFESDVENETLVGSKSARQHSRGGRRTESELDVRQPQLRGSYRTLETRPLRFNPTVVQEHRFEEVQSLHATSCERYGRHVSRQGKKKALSLLSATSLTTKISVSKDVQSGRTSR